MADTSIKPAVTVNFNALLALRQIINPDITRKAMAEELNATARKSRTQIRRNLSQQTKIPYSEVSEHVKLIPATTRSLKATIRVSDKVPTLGRFMTSYTKRPKSWRKKGWVQTMRIRVWAGSQRFPVHSHAPFVMPGGGGKLLIAVRLAGVTKSGKGKLKILSGPNLAGGKATSGEIQRLQTKRYIQTEMPIEFAQRVMARIDRIMNAKVMP